MDLQKAIVHVLAIDGGGIRGMILVRVLQTLEEMAQQPITQLFDLIVDTSTPTYTLTKKLHNIITS